MASTYIELEQVAHQLDQLIEEVGKGDEVIITRDSHPVAKLVAYPAESRRPIFGSAKGLITIADDFDDPLPEFEEYMR
jgi:antitoxin (DNA-binding transcriptional repressor) of toxin-antitoxin stability system